MEPVYQLLVWGFRCLRCEHEWLPRKTLQGDDPPEGDQIPRVCPRCKSPYWNRPRRVG